MGQENTVLFKTFIFGVFLGIGLAAAALYFVPAVDQGRERSMISVQANGGNRETFHVNLPVDRIILGRTTAGGSFPAGVEWPDHSSFAGAQTELFKVRNDDDKVVGVASRIAITAGQPIVEWAVHMPARGTMYVVLDNDATESGERVGSLRTGTREFAELKGSVFERYRADVGDTDEGPAGRLELITALVGPDVPFAPLDDGGDEEVGE